jgi:hypothetical protein
VRKQPQEGHVKLAQDALVFVRHVRQMLLSQKGGVGGKAHRAAVPNWRMGWLGVMGVCPLRDSTCGIFLLPPKCGQGHFSTGTGRRHPPARAFLIKSCLWAAATDMNVPII